MATRHPQRADHRLRIIANRYGRPSKGVSSLLQPAFSGNAACTTRRKTVPEEHVGVRHRALLRRERILLFCMLPTALYLPAFPEVGRVRRLALNLA